MPKYLCKTDLRTSSGALRYVAGDFYKGMMTDKDTLSISGPLDSIFAYTRDDANGWFYAFELVKVEWPKMMTTGGVVVDVQCGMVRIDLAGEDARDFGVESATVIRDWLNRYIETAESEAHRDILSVEKEETYGADRPSEKDRISLSGPSGSTTIEHSAEYSGTFHIEGRLSGVDLMIGNKSAAAVFQVESGDSEEYEMTLRRVKN